MLLLLVLIAGAAAPLEVAVEAPASHARMAERVRAMDSDEIERALAVAGLRPPARIRLVLVPDHDPRAAEVPRWVVGQAYGSDFVVIYPDRIGFYPYGSLESVVLHEIVHLALNASAGGHPLPRWFHEGVAVSVESGWGLTTQARLLIAAARGPAIEDVTRLFGSDAQPDTATAYLLAAALVEDVRSRHGLTVPGAIAAHVAQGRPFERAFWIETGHSPDEAAALAWRTYRGLSWLPVLTSGSAIWGIILALAGVAFLVRLQRRRERRRRWDHEDDEENDEDDEQDDEEDALRR